MIEIFRRRDIWSGVVHMVYVRPRQESWVACGFPADKTRWDRVPEDHPTTCLWCLREES
jgi:hypothetical protein